MDVLVERAPVEEAVREVVPHVFEDEEDSELHGHGQKRGEWYVSTHSKVTGEGVKEPDLGQLNGEVAEEDKSRTVPLFGESGDFLLGRLSSLFPVL